MNLASLLHQTAAAASRVGHALAELTLRLAHGVVDAARTMSTAGWALCAFLAAGSIAGTLVAAWLWPRETADAPRREIVDAAGIRQMAERGLPRADIARRTGMSHDAVATILRAAALPGRASATPMRKSRPRPA